MSAIGKAEQAGFTLTEMLVVLAILGLMANIAFPAVERSITQQRYRTAVGAVEAALREARANSISKGIETPFSPPLLPDGMALTSPRSKIRFFADGSANGGTIAITIGQRSARFTIDSGTGLIRTGG
jgi:prepilin-type N-terminal cleavage/methylation domain-containing protein